MQELLNTDILILGSGIAGSTTAIELAKANPHLTISLLTRAEELNESNTRYAQGGIIAKGGPDLVNDILKSGDGYSLPETAQIIADEGPLLVEKFLKDYTKVPFDESKDHHMNFALEGGHSEPRVAKVADSTGRSIQEHLDLTLKQFKNITIYTQFTAIDLLTISHHSKNYQDKYATDACLGAYVFNQQTNKVHRILAKKTVLATGGASQIFAFTTNPKGARGDGLAMAYRAGAKLLGLEFTQFHPTALKLTGAPPFLISEAVRGQGARLTDKQGTPFMQNYYPDLTKPDLTTRDKVSRAIFQEMLTTGTTEVYLDLKSYIKKPTILEHFPMIHEKCLSYGLDITKDLIPVSPAAHYSCGGVVTDLYGRTTLENLYAVGEVANTGLHGANRLASTSLLEGLVFGVRAAAHITKNLSDSPSISADSISPWIEAYQFTPDPALINSDSQTIKNLMWNMVGLVRKTSLLERAIADLYYLENTIIRFYSQSVLSDDLLGLRNLVLVALLTAKSALANPTSAGCHYRER